MGEYDGGQMCRHGHLGACGICDWSDWRPVGSLPHPQSKGGWWDDLARQHDAVRNSPVLNACAAAGMTERESLVALAGAHQGTIESFARYAELSARPITVRLTADPTPAPRSDGEVPP